jgi:hypothetical protein
VKSAIFAGNAARLYGIEAGATAAALPADQIDRMRTDYLATGGLRSNLRYGYVAARNGH